MYLTLWGPREVEEGVDKWSGHRAQKPIIQVVGEWPNVPAAFVVDNYLAQATAFKQSNKHSESEFKTFMDKTRQQIKKQTSSLHNF